MGTKGFTLIELMIAAAIVSILSMIAYPAYVRYVVDGHRANGEQFLMDLAQRQEQYLVDNRQYSQNLSATGLNMSMPPEVAQDYTLTISVNAAGATPFFQAALMPQSTLMTNDGRLFINSLGERWRETDNSCAVAACSANDPAAISWN